MWCVSILRPSDTGLHEKKKWGHWHEQGDTLIPILLMLTIKALMLTFMQNIHVMDYCQNYVTTLCKLHSCKTCLGVRKNLVPFFVFILTWIVFPKMQIELLNLKNGVTNKTCEWDYESTKNCKLALFSVFSVNLASIFFCFWVVLHDMWFLCVLKHFF